MRGESGGRAFEERPFRSGAAFLDVLAGKSKDRQSLLQLTGCIGHAKEKGCRPGMRRRLGGRAVSFFERKILAAAQIESDQFALPVLVR